jgi:hypothetical protein
MFSAGSQKYQFPVDSDGCVLPEALCDPRLSTTRAFVRLKLTVEGASLGATLAEIISTEGVLGVRLVPQRRA